MSLLSDMRAYLQRLHAGSTVTLAERTPIDREPLRRLVLAAVAEDDARGHGMTWRSPHGLLSDDDALISELVQQLADRVAAAPPEELPRIAASALVEILCDHYSMARLDGSGTSSLGPIQRILVAQAAEAAWAKYMERGEQNVPSPRLYALELGLIQMVGSRPGLTPLGDIFLRLTGADATRWPLAIELLTAIDRDDPWRGHESLATHLLERKGLTAYNHEFQFGPGWPWDNPALSRWVSMGLLKKDIWRVNERPDVPDGGESYTVTEFGSRLLQELVREPDAPIKSFARALLEDASDVILDVMPSRSGGAAASVVRHTRMLAHEMRNALVPVRYAYDQLWSRMPRDDARVALHRQHTTITQGLDRALRFVTDAARAVSSFAEESIRFCLGSALQEACTAVIGSTGVQILVMIGDAGEDIHIRGPRPRLIMALVNVLRNAVQAGDSGVKITATLTRVAGYVAVLVLDDSGPGIPDAQRSRLFEDGHSTHKHGTGHGLALVREVVEQDFSGSVHYETSPLGGARFVLRFPIPSEAT